MTELYQLKFSNGKSYIGISRCAAQRYRGHAKAAEKGASLLLSRAWRKYGAPKLKVLSIIEKSEAFISEQRAVAVFNTMTPQGYNMTPGGEIQPTAVPAIAAKVSRALLGKKKSASHRSNIAKGKSKQMLEYFKDPANRQLQSKRLKSFCDTNPQFGVALNKAGCDVLRGVPMSEEHKQRIGLANLGHEVSVETREKISAKLKGNVPSQESRGKTSATMKGTLAKLTPEELSERSKKSFCNWSSLTSEQKSARSQKTWATRRARGTDKWENKLESKGEVNMLRKVTKAVGRLKVGTQLDYPRGVWTKMAQDAGMKLEDFTVALESNAVLQSALKGKPQIRTRIGAAV